MGQTGEFAASSLIVRQAASRVGVRGHITNMPTIQSQSQKQKSTHRYVPMCGLIVYHWSVRHLPLFFTLRSLRPEPQNLPRRFVALAWVSWFECQVWPKFPDKKTQAVLLRPEK